MSDKAHKVEFAEDPAAENRKAHVEVDEPTRWPFYPNEWPKVDEIVMGRILSMEEAGAKVALLEYKMKVGLLLFTEVTRNRMKSYRQFFNVGEEVPMAVVRIDISKCYIDLSKKALMQRNDDLVAVKARYEQAKLVQRMMLFTAAKCEISPEKILQDISYRLYADYPTAYDGLKAIFDDHSILKKYTADMPQSVHDVLLAQIISKLTPPTKKCVVTFDATCMEGVDILRDVLLSATQMGEEDMPISVELKGPPEYMMSVEAPGDGEKGITLLREVAGKMKETLNKHRGDLVIKNESRM